MRDHFVFIQFTHRYGDLDLYVYDENRARASPSRSTGP